MLAGSPNPSTNEAAAVTPTPAPPAPALKGGALGLREVIMQGIAHIAPAIAALLTLQFAVSQAGAAAPLAYLFAFGIVMLLAISLTQLAKHIPSAGGFYTYISRTVHPRAGFLSAWLFSLYSPVVSAPVIAGLAAVIEPALEDEYGFSLPWWLFMVVVVAIVAVAVYRGVELSAKTVVILTAIEMLIVGVLSLWGIFSPGDGGLSLAPFNPSEAPSFNGLYLAVVFSIFAFTGFEAPAPIAEESQNPQRNIPRGIMWSTIILGAFLLLTSFGQIIGWGTNDIDGLAGSGELPAFALAHRFWGGAWIIVLLALLNSVIAGCIAYVTVGTRMWYAMARTGALPRALARVHPRTQVPTGALALEVVYILVVGLGVGFAMGPAEEFVFAGLVITLSLVPVYCLANLGVMRLYLGERRQDFNVLLHVVCPVLGSLALVWVGYKTIFPAPDYPFNLAIWIVLGWLAVGVAILVAMRVRGREEWLDKAGQVVAEAPIDTAPIP